MVKRSASLFWAMVRLLDLCDFKALLECGKESPGVYIYNTVEKSATRPPVHGIIWPVEFLLTKFSKKHVFAPVGSPGKS